MGSQLRKFINPLQAATWRTLIILISKTLTDLTKITDKGSAWTDHPDPQEKEHQCGRLRHHPHLDSNQPPDQGGYSTTN